MVNLRNVDPSSESRYQVPPESFLENRKPVCLQASDYEIAVESQQWCDTQGMPRSVTDPSTSRHFEGTDN